MTVDTDRFRVRLLRELEELREASDSTRAARAPVALDQQSVGRLSRMDALQNQAMAAGTDARRAQRGRAIRAALARIEQGGFGSCDACGEPIPLRRLDLDPCVVCCVACAG